MEPRRALVTCRIHNPASKKKQQKQATVIVSSPFGFTEDSDSDHVNGFVCSNW